jgi:inosine-uridine nucleoside N-ribohydrolase
VIPIILDTDLGSDIDDHWALAMILGSPELDLRLVTVGSGDTRYRAQLAAAMLVAGGRADVPIGIGPSTVLPSTIETQVMPDSAAEYRLLDYTGVVHDDGVGALVDAIMSSPQPVTLLTIGPVTNVAAALEREPRIVENSRVISMAADIRGGDGVEWNVLGDVPAFRSLMASEWDLTLSPIDTCGLIYLEGERYPPLRDSSSPLIATIMRAYREWHRRNAGWDVEVFDVEAYCNPDERTSILFDTLPVYLAYGHGYVDVEELPLGVDDQGLVKEVPNGRPTRVAITWRDLDGYLDHLTQRLLAAAGR